VTKRPEVRREELLDTALRLSGEVGFDEMSVESVTHAAGVAKGTFYHYFKSKDDLQYQLAKRFGDGLFGALSATAATAQGSATERLRALMDASAAYKLAAGSDLNERGGTVMLILFLYHPRNASLRRDLLAMWETSTRTFLRPVIAAGVADGSFDLVDVESAVDLIIGLWFDYADRLWLRGARASDTHSFVDIMIAGSKAMAQAQERILCVPAGTFTLQVDASMSDALVYVYDNVVSALSLPAT